MSYPEIIEEKDRLEAISFQLAWQSEQERIYATIPVQLRERLQEIYKKDSLKIHYSPNDFVDKLAWRIYTEWCMSDEGTNPDTYQGEALLKFIEREKYFAGERLMKKNIFMSDKQLTEKILEGLVARVCHLFSDWTSSMAQDQRNIRTSLQP